MTWRNVSGELFRSGCRVLALHTGGGERDGVMHEDVEQMQQGEAQI